MTQQELQLKRIADELDRIRFRITIGIILLYGLILAMELHYLTIL
jgi:hypothetical protein